MQLPANIRWIRRLIWAYFFLLIFEGALRKWVVPSLSNPLLLVRDPIVIAIYALAVRGRIFPHNWWIVLGSLIACLCLFAGLFALPNIPLVVLFGFRADFLHLPLIFIVPKVFDIRDVRRIGFWTLVTCLPMALLMIWQFKAPSTAWINAGAGEGSAQIDAAMGHIRPAGTFSFITGPVAFFPLAAAFLLHCQLSKVQYPRWLIVSSVLALCVSIGVSSSRTLAVTVGIVVLCGVIAGTVLQRQAVSRQLFMRTAQALCVLGIVFAIITQLSVFSEGLETFNARIQGASSNEGGAAGFAMRGLSDYIKPLQMISETPFLGYGLGLGTNAGSAYINNGQATYMLAEGEWARVILESGPVLGLAYLLLRVVLVGWLGWMAVQLGRRGNPLPFLLFGCCLPLLLNAQFGQSTEMGFAILSSGLTIAAMRSQQINASKPAKETSISLAADEAA